MKLLLLLTWVCIGSIALGWIAYCLKMDSKKQRMKDNAEFNKWVKENSL